MSEIPFYFTPPTPKYFREKGLFKNLKNLAFISWCFSRCSSEARQVHYDDKLITLLPYQFIFGRHVCCDETGLTEDEVRTQQNRWEKCNFLKKAPNKTPKRFTIYEWVLTAFSKENTQVNPQLTPKKPPSDPHNQEAKKLRSKKDHHPDPSSKIVAMDDDRGLMTDDLFSKEDLTAAATGTESAKPSSKNSRQHNIHNQTNSKQIKQNEIIPGIFLSDSELTICIQIKGSLESVKKSIEHIQKSPKRKYPIADWPHTLNHWVIKENVDNSEIQKRIETTKKLEEIFKNKPGWRCRHYYNDIKDQSGILIFNDSSAGTGENIFIPYVDPDFVKNSCKVFVEKGMKK